MNTQKIDSINLKLFQIVITLFYVGNEKKKSKFIGNNFLLAKLKIEIILKILFLIFSNMKQYLIELELFLRTHTSINAILPILEFELVDRKEFVDAFLNQEEKTCMVCITCFANSDLYIYLF